MSCNGACVADSNSQDQFADHAETGLSYRISTDHPRPLFPALTALSLSASLTWPKKKPFFHSFPAVIHAWRSGPKSFFRVWISALRSSLLSTRVLSRASISWLLSIACFLSLSSSFCLVRRSALGVVILCNSCGAFNWTAAISPGSPLAGAVLKPSKYWWWLSAYPKVSGYGENCCLPSS